MSVFHARLLGCVGGLLIPRRVTQDSNCLQWGVENGLFIVAKYEELRLNCQESEKTMKSCLQFT